MTDIRIEWLTDSNDCDQAGCSGGWEEGARVYFDGKLRLDLEPTAACFDGIGYSESEVLRRILAELGHTVEEKAGD